MKNLYEVLVEQLKDLYSAETQLIQALPEMVKSATNKKLSRAFEDHFGETKNQLKRLEKIEKMIKEKLDGHTCKAMKGLIKEAQDGMSETYKFEMLKDVMLVADAQRIEHYEIAGYGNAIALAEALGMSEIASMLHETIMEEGNADKGLTLLCQKAIFPECIDSTGEKVSMKSGRGTNEARL